MSITIEMPSELENLLQRKAEKEQRSVEALILDLLSHALEKEASTPSLEEIVRLIQSTPPNPASIRPASGPSLRRFAMHQKTPQTSI